MIEVARLTKMYGTTFAVRDVSFRVEKGDIFGFIGPNGAGKTTTIRTLATLLTPTSGDAFVGGFSALRQPQEVRRLIGYMPDSFGVYEEMRVGEYLEFFAAMYGHKGAKRSKLVSDILALVDMEAKREDVIGGLSRGTQQRLGLARVLVHDPQVLLLDEPASGIDPRARVEIRELIREMGRMGKTILISSHILPELGDLCNKVGIIEKGQMVFSGTIQEATRLAGGDRVVLVQFATNGDAARTALEAHPWVLKVEGTDGTLRVTLRAEAEGPWFIAEAATAAGARLTRLQEEEINLEDAFMRLTKGIVS